MWRVLIVLLIILNIVDGINIYYLTSLVDGLTIYYPFGDDLMYGAVSFFIKEIETGSGLFFIKMIGMLALFLLYLGIGKVDFNNGRYILYKGILTGVTLEYLFLCATSLYSIYTILTTRL